STVPGGVDESGRAVDEQPETSEARLALDARDEIVGQANALAGGPKDELAGMEDEGRAAAHLHELGDVVEWIREVDVRVLARAEHAKEAIEADVDRRRLHARGVEGIDADPARSDRRTDVTIRQDHEPEVCRVPTR